MQPGGEFFTGMVALVGSEAEFLFLLEKVRKLCVTVDIATSKLGFVGGKPPYQYPGAIAVAFRCAILESHMGVRPIGHLGAEDCSERPTSHPITSFALPAGDGARRRRYWGLFPKKGQKRHKYSGGAASIFRNQCSRRYFVQRWPFCRQGNAVRIVSCAMSRGVFTWSLNLRPCQNARYIERAVRRSKNGTGAQIGPNAAQTAAALTRPELWRPGRRRRRDSNPGINPNTCINFNPGIDPNPGVNHNPCLNFNPGLSLNMHEH